MTIGEYLQAVYTATRAHPDWRTGQTYFNVLNSVRPAIAKKICGSVLDPFHDSSHLPQFLDCLATIWDDPT